MIILSSLQFSCKKLALLFAPGAPLTYFNDEAGGGLSDFFWSEILAKGDFFGSMKNAGIFWVVK